MNSIAPSGPRVTVVVPAFNEAKNLAEVLPTLPPVHEVLVVDGNSSDNSREVVAQTLPSARFITQTRKGKGNALACGFENATGDIIVMFDADGSADANEIEPMVQALLAGADVAKGSRKLPGGGSVDLTKIRDYGNKFLTGSVNLLFKTQYTDLCYGYNAFWKDVLPYLALPSTSPKLANWTWGDGFEIETLINCRIAAAGLKVTEVPSMERDRIHGSSNLNAFKDGLRAFRTIIAEKKRSNKTRATAYDHHTAFRYNYRMESFKLEDSVSV